MTTTAITHRTGTYYGETAPMLIWGLADEQGVAAELYVDPASLTVMNIEVRADRRREGLARALWTAATATHAVVHAPEWARTPEGNAFAEGVGGDTITDEAFEAATGLTAA